jgi:hypothetical protein
VVMLTSNVFPNGLRQSHGLFEKRSTSTEASPHER